MEPGSSLEQRIHPGAEQGMRDWWGEVIDDKHLLSGWAAPNTTTKLPFLFKK